MLLKTEGKSNLLETSTAMYSIETHTKFCKLFSYFVKKSQGMGGGASTLIEINQIKGLMIHAF